jgi:hypothetical protein
VALRRLTGYHWIASHSEIGFDLACGSTKLRGDSLRCLAFKSLVEGRVKGRVGLGLPLVLGGGAIDLIGFIKSMTHFWRANTDFSDNY